MAGAAAAASVRRARLGRAYRLLSQQPRRPDLCDLDRLGVAAYLIGEDDEAVAAWEDAYKRHATRGNEPRRRMRVLGRLLSDDAGADGARRRLVEPGESVLGRDLDCPAAGYLLVPALLGALESDDDAEQGRRCSARCERGCADPLGDADLGRVLDARTWSGPAGGRGTLRLGWPAWTR